MNTLLFDPETGTTAPMRSKEEANDYRYFPDPDLPPVILTQEYIDQVTAEVTLLPWTAKQLLKENYELSDYDADILSREKSSVTFFQSFNIDKSSSSNLADFIINKALPYCDSEKVELSALNAKNIIGLIDLIADGKVAKSAALNELSSPVLSTKDDLDVKKLASDLNLIQSDDQDFLDGLITEVLSQNEGKVKAYRNGKKGLLGFFMGQVMGRSKGKANPKVLNEKLEKALNEG